MLGVLLRTVPYPTHRMFFNHISCICTIYSCNAPLPHASYNAAMPPYFRKTGRLPSTAIVVVRNLIEIGGVNGRRCGNGWLPVVSVAGLLHLVHLHLRPRAKPLPRLVSLDVAGRLAGRRLAVVGIIVRMEAPAQRLPSEGEPAQRASHRHFFLWVELLDWQRQCAVDIDGDDHRLERRVIVSAGHAKVAPQAPLGAPLRSK